MALGWVGTRLQDIFGYNIPGIALLPNILTTQSIITITKIVVIPHLPDTKPTPGFFLKRKLFQPFLHYILILKNTQLRLSPLSDDAVFGSSNFFACGCHMVVILIVSYLAQLKRIIGLQT